MQTGRGITRGLKALSGRPKVGRIGYQSSHNHHFLVSEVSDDGRSVMSYSGNSYKSRITKSPAFSSVTTANAYYSAFFPGSPNGPGY